MLRRFPRSFWFLAIAMVAAAAPSQRALAAATGCGQAQVELLLGAPPPPGSSLNYITPRQEVTPFYQWEDNNGYCGEVSLMSSGLINGQWMSQFNQRLICGAFVGPETNGSGASLLQAGNPLMKDINYNSQVLIEAPGTGVTGPNDFAFASRCAANARLQASTYPYTTGFHHANQGMAGYRDYMSWIKAQVIAGSQVTIAIYDNAGSDAQYDHEVSVLKIGTNHSPTDATYYADDVIYFEDHGVYSLVHVDDQWYFAGNPSIPLGAGRDPIGCTPYVYAYTFESLAHTRAGANAKGAPAYSIAIPDDKQIRTGAGNTGSTGNSQTAISGPHNYAIAVSGPLDADRETLPVVIRIVGAESQQDGAWAPNPWDANSTPAAGYGYETPYIGGTPAGCNLGQCVTNTQPTEMLLSLLPVVSQLKPGTDYNLYEYEFPTLTGADTGTAAALAVPVSGFNGHAAMATAATHFTATGATYSGAPISVSSGRIAVFRAVAAAAQ